MPKDTPAPNDIVNTFDAGNGLHFDRRANGSVRIIRTNGPHPAKGGGTLAKHHLSAKQWKAATAAMDAKPKPDKPDDKPGS